MPNSGSGELSIVDADTWHIVDLDPTVGGYGRAPLGTAAEQISASDDGCRILSANRGSCDLSLVDPSVLLAPTFKAAYGVTNLPAPTSYLQTIVPHRPDGSPLGAAPYEVAFLPQNTSQLDPPLGGQSLSRRRRAGSDGRFPRHGRNDAVASPGDVPFLRPHRAPGAAERADRGLLDAGRRFGWETRPGTQRSVSAGLSGERLSGIEPAWTGHCGGPGSRR